MRWYVFLVFLATVLSVASLLIAVFRFDPFQASGLVKSLFFTSLFIATWGMGTIIFSMTGALLGPGPKNFGQNYFRGEFDFFYPFFRKGLWLSLFLGLTIALGRIGLLNFVSLAIAGAFFIVVELMISIRIKKRLAVQDFS